MGELQELLYNFGFRYEFFVLLVNILVFLARAIPMQMIWSPFNFFIFKSLALLLLCLWGLGLVLADATKKSLHLLQEPQRTWVVVDGSLDTVFTEV